MSARASSSAKPPAHTCAVCPRPIAQGLLMCAHHWHQVPRDLQDAVNRTWRGFRHAQGPQRKLTAVKSYRDARDAAVAWVQPAEHQPQEGL